MNWRTDIENAPKDGTRIFIKGPASHGEPYEGVGWWTAEFCDDGMAYSGWTDGTEIEWGDPDNTGNYSDGPNEIFATHWMPLSDP